MAVSLVPLQDLADNITISMLSSLYLTVNQSKSVSVYSTSNFYQYNNLTLVLSYATAVVVTLCSVAIGVYASTRME